MRRPVRATKCRSRGLIALQHGPAVHGRWDRMPAIERWWAVAGGSVGHVPVPASGALVPIGVALAMATVDLGGRCNSPLVRSAGSVEAWEDAGNGRIPHRGGNPAGPRADAVRDKGCPHAPDSAAPESGRIAGRGPVGELLRLEAGRGVLSSDKPLEVSIWRSQQVSAGADAVLPEMLDSSFQAMTRRRYMRPWRFSMAAVTEPLGSLRLTNSTPAAREARSYGTCLTRENSAKSRVQPSASAPSPTGSAAPDRAGRRW